jgi:hypothetical protein
MVIRRCKLKPKEWRKTAKKIVTIFQSFLDMIRHFPLFSTPRITIWAKFGKIKPHENRRLENV